MRATIIQFQVLAPTLSIGDPANADELAKFRHWRQGAADTGSEEFAVDIPPALTPDGRPLVHGTSIAGPLRAWLDQYKVTGSTITVQDRGARRTRSAPEVRPLTLGDLLMGSSSQERDLESDDVAILPSAVRVVSCQAAGTSHDGRVRVAIDRRRGAAQPGKLFRRGHVAGATIDVTLRVDHDELAAALAARGMAGRTPQDGVEALLASLGSWTPQLGGQKSSGYGVGKLQNLRRRELDSTERGELVRLFSSSSTLEHLVGDLRPVQVPASPDWLTSPTQATGGLTCTFTLVDALLIDATADPGRPNQLNSASTVPATAWRGVLRSRCEFILRTLGLPACTSTDACCGRCPTCHLFGWTPQRSLRADPVRDDGAASLLRVHDSPLAPPGGSGQPGGLTRVTLPHVAIDRFSGGASDAKLYAHEVIAAPASLTLRIDVAAAARPAPDWAWPLLWLAIRDIDLGLVGIGAATTRGCGTIKAESDIGANLVGWPDALKQLRTEYRKDA